MEISAKLESPRFEIKIGPNPYRLNLLEWLPCLTVQTVVKCTLTFTIIAHLFNFNRNYTQICIKLIFVFIPYMMSDIA